MNLLQTAAEFLASQRRSFIAEPVEYHRFGGEVHNVLATPGKTLFRTDDVTGIVVRVYSFDFIILAEDLGFEPEKGDQIIYNDGVYEVLAPNNEPVWRWSGNSQDTYRIHTKFVGAVTAEAPGTESEPEAGDTDDEEGENIAGESDDA